MLRRLRRIEGPHRQGITKPDRLTARNFRMAYLDSLTASLSTPKQLALENSQQFQTLTDLSME